MLAPLANLIAFSSADAGRLGDLEARLASDSRFESVRAPCAGWVAARAPLTGTGPEPVGLRNAGIVFAEGQDRVFPSSREPTPSDVERVVAELDRDASAVGRLPGDFGFVRFRGPGSALVARSCRGLVPFFYTVDDDFIAVGTWLGAMVPYLPFRAEPDFLTCASWLTPAPAHPDGRSLIRGVRVVPPGHAFELREFRLGDPRRYWFPPEPARRRPRASEVRERQVEFRRLLLETMDRELDTDAPNLLMWSGGADSSALAAVAVNRLGRTVLTSSGVPASGPDVEIEEVYRRHLREHVALTTVREFELDDQARVEAARQSPAAATLPLHPLYSLLHLDRQRFDFTVVFGGEFADEVCGSGLTCPDWAAQTGIRDLARELWLAPGSTSLLAKRWLKPRLAPLLRRQQTRAADRLPAFTRLEVRQEFDDWMERERRRLGSREWGWRYLLYGLEGLSDTAPALLSEFTAPLGLRRTSPFLTREILELSLGCHVSEHVGATEKRLMHGALGRDVPAHGLLRPKYQWRQIEQRKISPTEPISDRIVGFLEPCFDVTAADPMAPARLQLALLNRFGESIDEVQVDSERHGERDARRGSFR